MIYFTKNVVWWGWEKNAEIQKRIKTKEKIPIRLHFPHPHCYDMEADCFPVSKNTENKPDQTLSERRFLIWWDKKKKDRVGRGKGW